MSMKNIYIFTHLPGASELKIESPGYVVRAYGKPKSYKKRYAALGSVYNNNLFPGIHLRHYSMCNRNISQFNEAGRLQKIIGLTG